VLILIIKILLFFSFSVLCFDVYGGNARVAAAKKSAIKKAAAVKRAVASKKSFELKRKNLIEDRKRRELIHRKRKAQVRTRLRRFK